MYVIDDRKVMYLYIQARIPKYIYTPHSFALWSAVSTTSVFALSRSTFFNIFPDYKKNWVSIK